MHRYEVSPKIVPYETTTYRVVRVTDDGTITHYVVEYKELVHAMLIRDSLNHKLTHEVDNSV